MATPFFPPWRRLITGLLLGFGFGFGAGRAATPPLPNILWLVNEDHGPQVGCYGDALARTPAFDALATRGVLYSRVWSCAPVCAPARTTLLSGLYAPSCGAEHMRSMVAYPAGQKTYPQLLREAGYYCSNNAKEDYNLATPAGIWDDSSKRAHWRNRTAGRPFMAVFNSEKSHESQIRRRPHTPVLDPARVRLPAYHPDTPEVRRDWAQYYDQVAAADADAAARLKELEEAGLEEDTVIFYYADHGSGMPRSKRFPYNSGLQVPLIVYIPEKFKDLRPPDYRPGGTSSRLVSFVDFAPTLLSLAGLKPPDWMQGSAFLGRFIGPAPGFLHGFRGRMDERLDLIRSVTDGRFVYLRNYLPHLPYGQHVAYMFETPTTRVWRALHDAGKLTPVQDVFWNEKPAEELYDLGSDPDETVNLANSPAHAAVRDRLRAAQREHLLRTRDTGFLPEGILHALADGSSPYDVGHDPARYDLPRILAAAERASSRDPSDTPHLVTGLTDPEAAVRHWSALGLQMRGKPAVELALAGLRRALDDAVPAVRVAAAHALARFGSPAESRRALERLVALADSGREDVFTVMDALAALDQLGEAARPVAAAIRGLPAKAPAPHPRYAEYVPRLIADLQSRFP